MHITGKIDSWAKINEQVAEGILVGTNANPQTKNNLEDYLQKD